MEQNRTQGPERDSQMDKRHEAASTASAGPLSRVALALDSPDREQILSWAREFGPRVGVLKLGLEAMVRFGPELVGEVRRHAAELFLDFKLHDIPKTVAGATAGAAELGADYLTIHAGGGPAMLEAAASSAGGVRLLAVTLLTHLDAEALGQLDLAGDGLARARGWAALARRAGCAGAVCSPLEVAALRSDSPPPFVLVTPGIRFDTGGGAPAGDDQRRVATPEASLAAGADLLVIGRPLTRAADPGRALAELERRLA